jgi:NAD(P)-dependent dehydrogenase (short-subunit alcohol dehydrogenase family)
MGATKSRELAARAVNESAGTLAGKSALVVGGTSGIGRAIAIRLAEQHADVTIVGRSVDRGAEVVAEMDKASSEGKHAFVQADAMLLSAVDSVSEDFLKGHPSLDFLVFCQTIATMQGRTLTPEGVDEKLALNLYSRIKFVSALLPALRAAPGGGRVLSVLSAGVHSPYSGWKDDIALEKDYSLKNAADLAGFYTDLAFDALASDPRNANVTFVHAAPGFVDTNWGTEMPAAVRLPIRALQRVGGRPAKTCAEYLSQGLLDPSKRGGLRLIGEFGQDVQKTAGHTPEARDAVWSHIKAVVGDRNL